MAARASAGSRTLPVALLLFGSGACALVYEVAWLRMLRLVFGASTLASAAALAIFLGGLGVGGLLLGRRADRVPDRLRLYANLEMGVALAAAASPLLVMLVRSVYIALGGTATLGPVGGTIVRLGLSALVLGLPTVLMGGTLPAAVRAVEQTSDTGRRDMGLLYGANTLGAVSGTLYATFFALEALGTNLTVWSASAANLGIALAARALARGSVLAEAADPPPVDDRPAAPTTVVLIAAAVVGFAFLLMELVWYRMLAPLLGGSSYTFGMILAVALLGIGLGGLAYAAGPRLQRPTLIAFAGTCILQALCLAVPFALGDRLALLALMLRPLGFLGFAPLVGVWLLVMTLVVLPAAVVAGYQFPLLVGLLGSGERGVGRQVGLAYASNTAGAIAGSLAGGFGLIPLLSAPGAWRGVVFLLLGLGGVSLLGALVRGVAWPRALVPSALAVMTALLGTAEGPTAFWRHSPIGAGRLSVSLGEPNDLRRLLNERRRRISWEADGVESSVALENWDAYSFIINGKNDGNAVGDASTQVMSGLIGAILTSNPKRALVIGLGTGSTAGWLAQIPSIERVDVVELESAILHVAAECSAVNREVLSNPKVHITIGDGREFLLTSSATYDVIFSEPSNPYRAGVASLFTRELYEAATQHLSDDGVFAQWVQAYEVEARTLRTVYATLGSVFPSVETWELKQGDLLLTASHAPRVHDLALLAARVETEPYRSALALIWGVSGVEGLYTGFVATAGLADALRHAAGSDINTDDRTLIEFEFARSVGREGLFGVDALRTLAAARGEHRPAVSGGALDWNRVGEQRTVRAVADGRAPSARSPDPALQQRILARQAYANGDLREAQRRWFAQDGGPQGPMDVTMVAEILAATGDPRAPGSAEELRGLQPAEAEAIVARWHFSVGHLEQVAEHLSAAFRVSRDFPWSHRFVLARSIELAWALSQQRPEAAAGLFDALSEPFAVRALDGERISTRFSIGIASDFAGRCAASLAPLEPYVPWEERVLEARQRCYTLVGHPLAARAGIELAEFRAAAPTGIEAGLAPTQPAAPR